MEIRIDGMSCMHCVRHVSQALQNLPGLTRLEVEIGAARFELNDPAAMDRVKEAIREAGYQPL